MKHYHLNKSHLNQDRLNQDSLVKYHCAKIFSYELRRLLANRFTLGLALITAFYSYWIMNQEIILGVANTAPWSPWSFGVYMARVMPLLLTALLFFISFHTSGQARAVGTLTSAAAIPPARFRLIRMGAILTAFLLLTVIPVGYGWGFYAAVFRYTGFTALAAPLCFVLLPSASLVMGAGMLCGRHCPALLYVLMALVLAAGIITLPQWLDLFGAEYLASRPAELKMLDPAFQMTGGQVIGRGVMIAAGVGMMMWKTIPKRMVP